MLTLDNTTIARMAHENAMTNLNNIEARIIELSTDKNATRHLFEEIYAAHLLSLQTGHTLNETIDAEATVVDTRKKFFAKKK